LNFRDKLITEVEVIVKIMLVLKNGYSIKLLRPAYHIQQGNNKPALNVF